MTTAKAKDIDTLSFEEAMAELETLIKQLEEGKVKLDEAITAYERGTLLRRHCEARLREAEMKVEQIQASEQGVSTKSFT